MLVAAFAGIAALVAIVIACSARKRIVTAIMIVLALTFMLPAGHVFLLFHPEWVDGRFRTYKKFYRDIQVGMTRGQVLAALKRSD